MARKRGVLYVTLFVNILIVSVYQSFWTFPELQFYGKVFFKYDCLTYENVYVYPKGNRSYSCKPKYGCTAKLFVSESTFETGKEIQANCDKVTNFRTFNLYLSQFDPYMEWEVAQPTINDKCETCLQSSATCSNDVIYDIGILPRRLMYPQNVAHLLNEILQCIYDLRRALVIPETSDNSPVKIALVIPPILLYKAVVDRIKVFMTLMDIPDIYVLTNNETQVLCFRKVVLPKFLDERPLSMEALHFFAQRFKDTYMKTTTCKDNQVTLVQRRNVRQLLNMDILLTISRSLGFTNASVVDLADLDMIQQFRVVQCSQVFVGVHGAGLGWFNFLPPGAHFVELSPNGWRKEFFTNKAERVRRDLHVHCMTCKGFVKVKYWIQKANEFGLEPDFNMDLKRRIVSISNYKPPHQSVWAYSNCVLNQQIFQKLMQDIKVLLKLPT